MKSFLDRDHIHTVMLDMDGTILDLHFDDHFWRNAIPTAYSELHKIPMDEVITKLAPEFESRRGTLEWYSLDFWSDLLGFNVARLKHQHKERIRYLPGAEEFLIMVRAAKKRLLLVTNSHRDAMSLKFQCTGLDVYFDGIYCAHDLGFPKEQQGFWKSLSDREPFDPSATLFADDNLAVLDAATTYGICDVVGIAKPDSQTPASSIDGFESVRSLGELIS